MKDVAIDGPSGLHHPRGLAPRRRTPVRLRKPEHRLVYTCPWLESLSPPPCRFASAARRWNGLRAILARPAGATEAANPESRGGTPVTLAKMLLPSARGIALGLSRPVPPARRDGEPRLT